MNNKLESTNHSKKHMSKKDDPPKLALEVEESVDLSTRVSMIVMMISAVIAGLGLAALLILPTQKTKTTSSVKVTAQKQAAAERIAKGLFMPDQILVKFKPNIKDQVKDNTINAVLDTPIKAMVDKSTGKVIQSYSLENSNAASELKEIKTSLKQRQKIIKNKNSQAEKAGLDRWELLSVSETDINQLVNKFKNDSNVEYAEPNYIGEATLSPSDTFYQPTEKLGVCDSGGSGFFVGNRCYQDSNCNLPDQTGGLCIKATNTIPVQWGAQKVNTEGAWDVIYSKRGDANGDGTIDKNDYIFLYCYVNHTATTCDPLSDPPKTNCPTPAPAPNPIELGDVNGDDQVNNYDLDYLRNYVCLNNPPAPVDYSKNIVKVAVIDSGIDYNHPDISDNVWVFPGEIPNNGVDDDGNGWIDDYRGRDFTTCEEFDSNGGCKQIKAPGNDVMDYMSSSGHGTHVAGLVSSRLNNSLGLTSIGGGWYPEKAGVKVMAVKALNQKGKLLVSDLSEAIAYAADQGAKVINLSLAVSYSQLLAEHVLYAQNQGSLIVAAAGNFKTEALLFSPGNLPGVSTVAASDENDLIWRELSSDGSNYGANISVAAPGKDIISLKSSYVTSGKNIVADNYFLLTGTSQAAPQVSALAALIWAKHPEFTSEQVKSAIKMGADDMVSPLGGTENLAGWDPYAGQGRINAYKSLLINYPLVAQINSPENSTNYTLGESITISGSVGGDNYKNYKVEYIKADDIKQNTTASWTVLSVTNPNAKVNNGTLATWNTNGLAGGSYYLRVTAFDNSGYILSDHRLINITHPLHNINWSTKQVNNFAYSSLIFADLDTSHPGMETLLAGQSKVYAWYQDGSNVTGWPIDTEGAGMGVAVADIDNDGNNEVIANNYTYLYVWRANGEKVLTWQWPTGHDILASPPAIADLDNDKDLEIVFSDYIDQQLYVYHHDGKLMANWPLTIGSLSISTPALADLDNDGDKEIVVGFNKLYVYHHDGRPMWSQEIGGGTPMSSPAIVDLDRDANNDLEILIGGGDNKVYAFHDNGTAMAGWPVQAMGNIYSSPAVGDLDNNGDIEVIAGSVDGRVYVWNQYGSIIDNRWPVQTGGQVNSSPVLADLDGDGDLEIAVGSADGKIYVWHHNSASVTGFPVMTTSPNSSAASPVSSTPAIADLDGDGKLEIGVVNEAGKIYIWDLPWSVTSGKLPWSMFHRDQRHTGLYNQCSDYTQWKQCNKSKQYCDSGNLVNNCTKCGCPSDKPYCNTSSLLCETKCTDGTPFSQCNASKQYCDNGNLKYSCNKCSYTCPANKPYCMTNGDCAVCRQNSDCPDNLACTNDICNSPGTASSYCSHPSNCPSAQPYCNQTSGICEAKCSDGTLFGRCNGRYQYCSAGKLYNWCMSCGCPGGGTCKKTSGGGTCIGGGLPTMD